jgi:methylglyoxal synthase
MNIALIANDSKKKLMENICVAYRNILNGNKLYATGTTGRIIEETTGLIVHKYLAGHLGGQQQLAAQIAHNDIDLVIFLRDPHAVKRFDSSGNDILIMCDIHNIPLATNLSTAEVLLLALHSGDLDWRNNINK